MHQNLKELFITVKDAHEQAYVLLQSLTKDLSTTGDVEELTDAVYATREVMRFAEDLLKETRRLNTRTQQMACAVWAKMPDPPERIVTDYCSGTPDIKMSANLPKRDTAEYHQFMTHIGVKNVEDDLVRPHWPSVKEYISDLTSQGRPLPPGVDLDETFPVYTLSVRRKADVV